MIRRFALLPLMLWSLLPIGRAAAQEMMVAPDNRSEVSGYDGKYAYREIPGDPLNGRYYTLDNGLTVILSVNKSEPRIQTMIAVKAGSKNDPADNTGLAHYLEHMLFKGTDRYGTSNWAEEKKRLDVIEDLYDRYNHTTDAAERTRIYHMIDSVSGVAATYAIANEYDKMVGAIGASGTNAFTSFEETVYINDIPSNQLDKWLTIEGERFRSPVFRLFHTELEAVYEEKNISLDDDGSKVYETMLAGLFSNHPYGTQTTIGTVEHLKNPSLRKIREYYNTYYVPNNMAVILVGDIDPAKTIALIDRHFSDMKRKDVPQFSFKSEPTHSSPQVYEVVGPEAENVSVVFRSPGAGTRQALLLELTDLLLAYKGAGLIDLDLNKKQLVGSAGCSPSINKDYGWHYFFGTPRDGQTLEEVKDLMLQEIEKIKRGEFDESAIQACVRNLKVDQMKQYESNTGRAFALLQSFVTGVDPEKEATKFDDMEKLTKKDVMEFAKRFYTNDYVVVYKRIGDPEESVKVEKPSITPVEVNREARSPFVEDLLAAEAPAIQPVFIDYANDIDRSFLRRSSAPLLSVKNTENDLFELYYVFEMGSDNDKRLPYAVNYLEYLGTDKYSAEELSKKFFMLGCSFNVSTGRDRVFVSLTGPDESMESALALFEEFLANAKPDQEALDGMIDQVLKDRADAKLNKGAILFSGLRTYAMYGEDNPFNDVLSESELRAITPNELVERIHTLPRFQHRVLYYGPKSISDLSGLLERYHTEIGAMPPPPAKEYTRLETDKNVVYFADYDMVQAEVVWLNKSEPYNMQSLPERTMFNEYFGGGMSSVVFQEIRESKALAYSTFSSYQSPSDPKDPHYIFSYVGTQADKLGEAIKGMNELHTTLPKSSQGFNTAKAAVKNKIETERVTKSAILFDFLTAEKFGRSEDSRKTIYQNIDAIDMDDLVEFHKSHYTGKPFAYCVIGSKEKVNMEELAKLGTVVELSLEDLFGY